MCLHWIAACLMATALPGAARAQSAAATPRVRTSTGVRLPLANVARYFSTEVGTGMELRVDTARGLIAMGGPATDQIRLFTALGDLPARVRITATITVAPCATRYVGVVFGGVIRGAEFHAHMVSAADDGVVRAVELGRSGLRPLGNPFLVRPAEASGVMRRQFVLEVRGTTLTVAVDGQRGLFQLNRDGIGTLGLASSGGGCVAIIDGVSVTPLP